MGWDRFRGHVGFATGMVGGFTFGMMCDVKTWY